MGNPESEVLKLAFAAAKAWNERSTILVMGGVIIEFAALLVFSRDMPRREKIALFIGNVLVIVGVGGEWIFGGREADAASTLQQLSDQKVAALQVEQEFDHKTAAQAAAYAASLGVTVEKLPALVNAKLAIVNGQYDRLEAGVDAETKRDTALIAQFNRDKGNFDKARADALASAETANEVLADVKSTQSDINAAIAKDVALRAEFEMLVEPRDIPLDGQRAIAEKLKPFRGHEIRVEIYQGNWEAWRLMVIFGHIFAADDIKMTPTYVFPDSSPEMQLLLGWEVKSPQSEHDFADTLFESIKSVQTLGARQQWFVMSSGTPVTLFIGVKPFTLPPLLPADDLPSKKEG